MSDIKKTLKELNPELFSTRQPSVLHDIFVTGRKVKNTEGDGFTITYLQRTRPNEAAKAAKVAVQDFIHASFKPVGAIETLEDGSRSFKGPKKAQVGVIFLNTQPDLYNFVKAAIEAGKDKGWKEAGFDQQKRPVIKLNDKMWGAKVVFNTPLYTPHSPDAEGKMQPLTPTTYDPATGKYEKKKVTIGVLRVFADDDDLDMLLEVAARHTQKRVMPFLAEKVTKITEKGGKKVIEVKEDKLADPDQITETDDTPGEGN